MSVGFDNLAIRKTSLIQSVHIDSGIIIVIMPEQFDWRTDDEVWADEPVSKPEPVTAVSRRVPWLAIVAILVFLSVAVFVVYHQLNQRIETAHKAIEAEILLTHNLVQRANLQQDDELFRSILSGRDPDWTDLQLDLVREGHLFDRAGLGLQAQTAVTKSQVTVASDLKAAELLFEQEHALQNGDGVTETVRLQHMAVYRLGQKWLYAPPTEEFWGSWQTLDGRYLSIAYRQRDADIVSQLAFDFEALIGDVCRLPDMNCPSDLHLHLRLDSEAESLLITADTQTLLEHSLRLNLPTPSLVGVPIDEAGYQALLQGYGRHLAAAIIVQQANYACCDRVLLHQALLDWQLYQLGLRSWPLTTADYDQLLYNNAHTTSFSRGWFNSDNPAHGPRSAMLVQFLVTESTELSPIAIQRLLQTDLTYTAWVRAIIGESFDEKLLDFLIAQIAINQSAQTVPPLPEQDILYVCQSDYVYQYDLHSEERSSLLDITDLASDYVNLRPLTDGYILEERYFNSEMTEDRSVLTLVDSNGRRPLIDTAADDTLFESTYLSDISPDNRYFVFVSYDSDSEEFARILLDSADCPDDVCRRYPVPGSPVWSPSGRRMLWQERTAVPGFSDPGLLMVANARGQNPVQIAEDVVMPFWLDEQTVGYVRLEGIEQVLISRQLDDPLELVMAWESDLRVWMPDLEPTQPLFINFAKPAPANPDLILVMATSGEQSGTNTWYYFLLERKPDGNKVALWQQTSDYAFGEFSPDGRFLTFIRNDPTAFNYNIAINILDLETGQEFDLISQRTWPGLEWSADGNWLVQFYDEYLLLMAPAYDYKQVFPGKFSGCGNVIWLNK